MPHIASVCINGATREFDKEYHYSIPSNLYESIKPGVRVIVPFGKGNRTQEAYVVDLVETSSMDTLKEVKCLLDATPVLSSSMLKLARWMKQRYICTYSEAIRCMLPPGMNVKSLRMVKLLKYESTNGKNMGRILDLLQDTGLSWEVEEMKKSLGIKSLTPLLKKLEERGLVAIEETYTAQVKEKYVRVAYLDKPREEVLDELEGNSLRSIQQIRILEMLLDNPYIAVSDIVRFAGVSAGVLNTLKKYGYVDFMDIEVMRDPLQGREYPPTQPLTPTLQQAQVLEKVRESLARKTFEEVLLHGVTGSGKTEIYIQLIHYTLEMGRQAIVLVPEISLTPQMVQRFKGRFGNDVAVLHSRLSLGERYDQWRLIKDGRIKVVVGARSAVFAPLHKPGLFIIDEEHENSYKSETTPKYHVRDVARERCSLEGAVMLSGTATPAVESYYRALKGEIALLEMKDRANKMVMPAVELIDMRRELEEGNRSVFSSKLAEEIRININRGEQTILFLNRRGYSSFVMCRSCGYTMKCNQCNVSLTYHASENRLICHYCGYTCRNPINCPKCGSSYIRQFGTGTQKVEEELKKHFPGCSVIRMDMDTTSYKNSHEEILRAFREQNINIMVGTQMIAKGHDFPNVTLVGVLAADSLLNLGDYNASEKTFQLITQVAGRSGRGELPGRVVVQSYNTEDFSILAACRHDYNSFYHQEILLREKMNYPPFTSIAVLVAGGLNDKASYTAAKDVRTMLAGELAGFNEEVEILGPARAPLSKIKNKYRWRIIVKCGNTDILISVLGRVSDRIHRKKGRDLMDLSMDINPSNML